MHCAGGNRMRWADFWAFFKSRPKAQQTELLNALFKHRRVITSDSEIEQPALDDWTQTLSSETLVEILTNAPVEISMHLIHLLNGSGARRIIGQYSEKESAQLLQAFYEKRPEFKPKPRKRSKTLVAASWLEELENQ